MQELETVKSLSNSLDFNDYFPRSISIYAETSFNLAQILPAQAKDIEHDLDVFFELKGDISGLVQAQINTKSLDKEDQDFVQGLFLEGANIIIGQILTLIDKDHDLISLLSTPKFTKEHERFEQFYNVNKALYFLTFKNKEIPLSLNFYTLINTPKEV